MTKENDIKDLKLVAQIGEIQLIIVTETEDLAHMFITKLNTCVSMNKSDIQIDAKLQNISVFDSSSDTIYKHVSLLKVIFINIYVCLYIIFFFMNSFCYNNYISLNFKKIKK